MGILTNTCLLIQTCITFSKVSCNSKYSFMKSILLCMLGQSITGILIGLADINSDDGFGSVENLLGGTKWLVLSVNGMVILVYWISIYMTTWLVAFKYWETSTQMEKMEQIMVKHSTELKHATAGELQAELKEEIADKVAYFN